MHLGQQAFRKTAPGQTRLVGDHHDRHLPFVQHADGHGHTGQEPEAADVIDIAHLLVDGAVPVEKNCGFQKRHIQPSIGCNAAKTSSQVIIFMHWKWPSGHFFCLQGLYGRAFLMTTALAE